MAVESGRSKKGPDSGEPLIIAKLTLPFLFIFLCVSKSWRSEKVA